MTKLLSRRLIFLIFVLLFTSLYLLLFERRHSLTQSFNNMFVFMCHLHTILKSSYLFLEVVYFPSFFFFTKSCFYFIDALSSQASLKILVIDSQNPLPLSSFHEIFVFFPRCFLCLLLFGLSVPLWTTSSNVWWPGLSDHFKNVVWKTWMEAVCT